MGDTRVAGTPARGLAGATLGFFIGFAAVSLFGPTVRYLQEAAGFGPVQAGLLVSIPSLTGSLLRIPFSALVDTTGGRKPFLILLGLSAAGLAGLWFLLSGDPAGLPERFPGLLAFGALGGCGIATFSVGISQTSYWYPQRKQGAALGVYAGLGNLAPGIFAFLLSALSLPLLGLSGSYLAWLGILAAGTAGYALLGRNAPYFQLRSSGLGPEEATRRAREDHGQELFPRGSVRESLAASASEWRTWALTGIYFTTFGGFLALTAWLPKYWGSYFGLSLGAAGSLAALFSVSASLFRAAAGGVSDRLGGARTLALALGVIVLGAAGMALSGSPVLSAAASLVLALGMGAGNAATFKLVPQLVPRAVSGAVGWVGGLGAFGGFLIPNGLALFLGTVGRGDPGYARGFWILVLLGLASLGLVRTLAPGNARERS